MVERITVKVERYGEFDFMVNPYQIITVTGTISDVDRP